jgi:hypothetical protein
LHGMFMQRCCDVKVMCVFSSPKVNSVNFNVIAGTGFVSYSWVQRS